MKFFVKTFGWAAVSGLLFFFSAVVCGTDWWPAAMATLTAVSLKTPFYALYEWAFHAVWKDDYPKAEPLEHEQWRHSE